MHRERKRKRKRERERERAREREWKREETRNDYSVNSRFMINIGFSRPLSAPRPLLLLILFHSQAKSVSGTATHWSHFSLQNNYEDYGLRS